MLTLSTSKQNENDSSTILNKYKRTYMNKIKPKTLLT